MLGDRRQSVWRKRIVALATAYVVAISGLLASFGAARAAADGTFDPLAAICHHGPAGPSDPFDSHSNGNSCISSCCIGCLTPVAALPPPPITIVPSSVAISHRVVPPAVVTLGAIRPTKSHRSRAPPYAA